MPRHMEFRIRFKCGTENILGSFKSFQIIVFQIISRIRYYLVHIYYLTNQSGSGITLDSVIEFLSKQDRYIYLIRQS